MQTIESVDESSNEDSESDSDVVETAHLTKGNKPSSRKNSSSSWDIKDHKNGSSTRKHKESSITTWEELDEAEAEKDEVETNMGLVVSLGSDSIIIYAYAVEKVGYFSTLHRRFFGSNIIWGISGVVIGIKGAYNRLRMDIRRISHKA